MPSSEFLPPERQRPCRLLLNTYFNNISNHVVEEKKILNSLESENEFLLQTKGEIPDAKKEKYNELKTVLNKLLNNLTILADYLDLNMPELPKISKEQKLMGIDIFQSNDEYVYEGDHILFEDDETRKFYEALRDLKEIVPKILYKESLECTYTQSDGNFILEHQTDDDINADDVEEDLIIDEMVDDVQEPKFEELEEDDVVLVTNDQRSLHLLFNEYLEDLERCVNRDMIDNMAQMFTIKFNTKANRRKLVKTLFYCPRTRYDLLPFYSRFVATLAPIMPDVNNELIEMLRKDFYFRVYRKDQIHIDSKLKVTRFLAELTKFKLFRKHDMLFCLKTLMKDFSHHHIEMACVLLETCGRFLYKSPESHHLTSVYLEVLQRKKQAMHLDTMYTNLLDNAFYYTNPPKREKGECKEPEVHPQLYRFIRQLLYKELRHDNVDKIIKVVRKMDWEDPEGNLVTQVIDDLLDCVRTSMEAPNSMNNQRKILLCRYLSELYNYRLINSTLLIRILYHFISFMCHDSEIDPPTNLSRIRMVITLLDGCGIFVDKGKNKEKLSIFLIYFQRYIWIKRMDPSVYNIENPFPQDIVNIIKDLLDKLRNGEMFYSEAICCLRDSYWLDIIFQSDIHRRNPNYPITDEVREFINFENDPSAYNGHRPQAGDLDSIADRTVTLYAAQRKEHRRQLLADGLIQSDGEGCATAPAPSEQDVQPSRFSKTRRYNPRASQYPHLPPTVPQNSTTTTAAAGAANGKRVKLKSYAVPPVDHKTLGRHVSQLKRLLPRAPRYTALLNPPGLGAAGAGGKVSRVQEVAMAGAVSSESEEEEDTADEVKEECSSSSEEIDEFEGCDNYSNESESDGEAIVMGRSDEECDFVEEEVDYDNESYDSDADRIKTVFKKDVSIDSEESSESECEFDEEKMFANEFKNAFEAMVSESLHGRQQELKQHQIDISIPTSIRAQIREEVLKIPEDLNMPEQNTPGIKKLILMSRKGNKQNFTNLEIPVSDSLVVKIAEREEKQKEEQKKIKQAVLGCHERQEQEEYQEMIQKRTAALNSLIKMKEPRSKYTHQKGVPNTSDIF